jgi:hypothetical protein
MDVDTVEQGAGDLRQVSLDLQWRWGQITVTVLERSSWARVHGCNKHETGRVPRRNCDPRNGELTVFERLAQHFESAACEFRQLIEEENAVVGQAHFSGPGRRASADKSDVTGGVVGASERPDDHERPVVFKLVNNRIDFCGLTRFFEAQGREDSG